MKTVLCIDAGDFGGGSAESLSVHIKTLKHKYNFICLFSAKSRFSQKIERLDVPVHYSCDNYFNIGYIEKNKAKAKLFNFLYKLTFHLGLHRLNVYTSTLFNKRFFRKFEEILNNGQIDIIHTNNQPNRDFGLFIIASNYNLHVVSHVRSSNTYAFSTVKARFCNEVVSSFITYSSHLAELWTDKKIDRNKLHVIPNAVDQLSELELLAASKPICDVSNLDCTKIGLVGRIIPERGHLFALEVLRSLNDKGRPAKLFIIGDFRGFEKYFETLMENIRLLKLTDYVVFTGFVDNPYQYIANMDISLLPYSIEPFGRTMLESWQLGTPVVLSDVGRISDVVQDRHNAMLFRANSLSGSVSCIESLLDDDDLRNKITSNAYLEFCQRYTTRSYGVNVTAIYDAL